MATDPRYVPPDRDHPMPDGGHLHMYNFYGNPNPPKGVAADRNVHRYSPNGDLVWIIQPCERIEGGASSYTWFEPMPNGKLHIHAGDGSVFFLNVDTGEVTFLEWEK